VELNRIIQGDALSVLKTLSSDSVDLIVTDPPYGLGIAAKGTLSIKGSSNKVRSFSKSDWDTFIPTKEYFDEILRVSKNQIIWGGNYFAHLLPPAQCWLVWWKKDGLPRGSFADCELAWTSFKRPALVYNSRWHGFIRDSKEERIAHPTQKALDVMRWCIEEFSKPTDLIADPFLGSGTIAVAAKQLGRNYLGIELNPEYVKIAEKRLMEAAGFPPDANGEATTRVLHSRKTKQSISRLF
jgi:DNA modification methylase